MPSSTPIMSENAGEWLRIPARQRHPGLQLDRFTVPPENQEQQYKQLLEVTHALGDREHFKDVKQRRDEWFSRSRVINWAQTTDSPLTLHLSRSNVLENAGLSLHPVYGFPYLPGTGLKGMTRAFAEQIVGASEEDIVRVFGNKHDCEPGKQRAGRVVFMDAWPVSWPALTIDIGNNHHGDYYNGKDAPGDWESPVPVYFLVIPAGNAFDFGVRGRRDDDGKAAELAKGWLHEALVNLGAGAKTAAGYGYFQPTEDPPKVVINKPRLQNRVTVRLTSPAFLAGADQSDMNACDLRVPTLRGLLREWWRKLHSGTMSSEQLLALEGSIWGSTDNGSPVQLRLNGKNKVAPTPYSHPEESRDGRRYLGYGMDENKSAARHVMPVGKAWELTITVADGKYYPPGANRKPKTGEPDLGQLMTRQQIMDQVQATLFAFSRYGGVGAKNRKGFGSFVLKSASDGIALIQEQPEALTAATHLRQSLNIGGEFDSKLADSGSLIDQDLKHVEVELSTQDPEQALDMIGRAYQAVASSMKHDPAKAALGLPRKIHGPQAKPFRHQDKATHQKPQNLRANKGDRHAAPIYVHLEPTASGQILVRVLAVPALHLPDRKTSVEVLAKFMEGLEAQLKSAQASSTSSGKKTVGKKLPTASAATMVEVKILEKKTSKKTGDLVGFQVQEEGAKPGMLNLNQGTPPDPLPSEGDVVTVYWNPTSSKSNPTYRWTPPAPPKKKGRGGKGGGLGRRR